LKRAKIRSWIPTGAEIKNDCAGKGQQQITAPLISAVSGYQSAVRLHEQQSLSTEAEEYPLLEAATK
jgi:hypothetical protein